MFGILPALTIKQLGAIGSAVVCGQALAGRAEAASFKEELPTVGKITKTGVKYFEYRVGEGVTPRSVGQVLGMSQHMYMSLFCFGNSSVFSFCGVSPTIYGDSLRISGIVERALYSYVNLNLSKIAFRLSRRLLVTLSSISDGMCDVSLSYMNK